MKKFGAIALFVCVLSSNIFANTPLDFNAWRAIESDLRYGAESQRIQTAKHDKKLKDLAPAYEQAILGRKRLIELTEKVEPIFLYAPGISIILAFNAAPTLGHSIGISAGGLGMLAGYIAFGKIFGAYEPDYLPEARYSREKDLRGLPSIAFDFPESHFLTPTDATEVEAIERLPESAPKVIFDNPSADEGRALFESSPVTEDVSIISDPALRFENLKRRVANYIESSRAPLSGISTQEEYATWLVNFSNFWISLEQKLEPDLRALQAAELEHLQLEPRKHQLYEAASNYFITSLLRDLSVLKTTHLQNMNEIADRNVRAKLAGLPHADCGTSFRNMP